MHIVFVLGARSELGYILPVYREAERRGHRVAVWACNTASLSGYGDVALAAREQGVDVRQVVLTSFDGYSRTAMAKSVGAVSQSFADYLSNEFFDWVILSGDRAEQLGAAVTSSYMYLPTAHIQAGERSGNIDGLARHAIARLVHLHFASNRDASDRLIRSGEEEWRVIQTGAPQLDGLVDSASGRADLQRRRIVPKDEYILAAFHPETTDPNREFTILRALISKLTNQARPVVWIAPNNDAGALAVRRLIQENLRRVDFFHENLSRPDFAGVLANCSFIVGNSSAGIIEAPNFRKVAINLGRRQHARFQGANVINVDGNPRELDMAFDSVADFARGLLRNDEPPPYGDGRSSARILDALESLRPHPKLLHKQITY